MKYSHLFQTALLIAGLTFVGCQSRQDQPQTAAERVSERADTKDHALVRFVNALPGSASTDAFFDSLRTFDGVNFKTITPYRQVPDGRHVIALGAPAVQAGSRTDDTSGAFNRTDRDRTAEGRSRPEESQSFAGGNFYTVIAHPDEDNGQPKITVIKDDLTDNPPKDKARVRVIDASRQVGDIDVVVQGRRDPILKGVGSLEGNYKEIDPVSGSLHIRPEGKDNTLATVSNQNFEAGKSYTVILTGSKDDPKRLDAIAVEDQLASRNTMRNTQGNSRSDYDRDDQNKNDRMMNDRDKDRDQNK